MVVLFTLYLKEDVDDEGNIKEGVIGGKLLEKTGNLDGDGSNGSNEKAEEPNDDDLD